MKKEFKVEGGNSTTGEVGFVAYVQTDDREKAVERVKDLADGVRVTYQGIEIIFYINPDKTFEVEPWE